MHHGLIPICNHKSLYIFLMKQLVFIHPFLSYMHLCSNVHILSLERFSYLLTSKRSYLEQASTTPLAKMVVKLDHPSNFERLPFRTGPAQITVNCIIVYFTLPFQTTQKGTYDSLHYNPPIQRQFKVLSVKLILKGIFF